MTLIQFATKLIYITEKSALKEAIVSFVNTPPTNEDDLDKLNDIIEAITDDGFTSFGQNLGFCKNYCIEELKKDANKDDKKYSEKLTLIKNLLDQLSKIYQNINEKRQLEKSQNNDYTIDQNKDVLREVKRQTQELKADIDKANRDIKKANESLDNKMFTLLLNTVAILGIFVAIAFAGFGITSLFSNIDFEQAFESQSNLVKTVFFLLMMATLSYNLLLMLVYFIYKLSRPLFTRGYITDTDDKPQDRFMVTVKLPTFIVIDAILFIVTILLFIWCQFI